MQEYSKFFKNGSLQIDGSIQADIRQSMLFNKNYQSKNTGKRTKEVLKWVTGQSDYKRNLQERKLLILINRNAGADTHFQTSKKPL